jgi:phosphoserine phosphatase RsbU/P
MNIHNLDQNLIKYLNLNKNSNPSILEIFPELIGDELEIKKIITGKSNEFHLPLINRTLDTDIYFNILILPYPDDKYPVILFINDITEETIRSRNLQQSSNEITLLNQKLKESEKALKISKEKLKERNDIMEIDLELSRRIQTELLFKDIPECNFLKIEFKYLPLEKVGGDYFSFNNFNNNEFGLFIGDVSGHGVASALFHTLLKSTIERLEKINHNNPSKFLENLNLQLLEYMSSYFLTGIYGLFIYDNNSSKVKFIYSSGGHPYPIILRKNGNIETIKLTGMVIGIFDTTKYKQKTVELNKGDRIFFFTDGISETMNKKGQMINDLKIGMEKFFSDSNKLELSDTINTIIENINIYREDVPLNDDILIIGIEII